MEGLDEGCFGPICGSIWLKPFLLEIILSFGHVGEFVLACCVPVCVLCARIMSGSNLLVYDGDRWSSDAEEEGIHGGPGA